MARLGASSTPCGSSALRRPGSDVLWIGGLLALGILLRAVYLFTPGLDSDRAVVGLMARHILGGEFPIFFWGQPYGGTLEAHLAALLFYVFGSSRLTLSLSPLLFSTAFLVLTYFLARDLFDRPTGRVALLLAAIGPASLVAHGVTTWGHYISHLTLGTLVLLLAFRTARLPAPPRRLLFLLGFFAGLAWYNSPQSVHYLLAGSLFVLLHQPRLVWRRDAWLVAPAFLLGSTPLWVYNLGAPATSTFAAIPAHGSRGDLGHSLRLLVEKVPHILGATGRGEGLQLALDVGLLGLYALALVHLLLLASRLAASRLVLLLLVVTSGIVVVGYNRGGATRYLLPLYSALPVMMAAFLQALRRRSVPLFAVALGGLLAANLAGNVAWAEVLDGRRLALYQGRREREARLFGFLRADGLTRVYVFDYWDAYRLTFDAAEHVVFAEPTPGYYPLYTRMVDMAARYGYVFRRAHDAQVFEENLRSLGGEYRRREVGGYAIFDSLQPLASPPLRELSSRDWQATASHTAADAHRAFDRDPATTWTTGSEQRPGIYYELDLGEVRRIGQVILDAGATAAAAPHGFRIDTSSDGARWTTAHTLSAAWPGLAWVGSRLRADASGGISARFAPVPARWVRITLLRDRRAEWAIRELFVSEASWPVGAGFGGSPPQATDLRVAGRR